MYSIQLAFLFNLIEAEKTKTRGIARISIVAKLRYLYLNIVINNGIYKMSIIIPA